MILVGALLGIPVGGLLSIGFITAAGLHVYGPAGTLFTVLSVLGVSAAIPVVAIPLLLLLGLGLALLIATIFAYAWCAVVTLGVPVPATPPAAALTPAPLELAGRGFLLGLALSVNGAVMSTVPLLWPLAFIQVPLLLGSLIPAVAASRPYQVILGGLGWTLPLNYLMFPIGILLFVINAPTAIGAIRFDSGTMTLETRGGLVASFIGPRVAFNLGNVTFLGSSYVPPPAPLFTAPTISTHETGHTLSGAALGGFFFWIGAIDENAIRTTSALAYSELLAESHFGGGTGGPFLPMW
jgi:hypothetical protein